MSASGSVATVDRWACGPRARVRARLPDPLPGHERWRLPCALLLSLILHGLLLRLAFDGQGLGIPVFKFLWGERRVAVSELNVELPSPPVAVTPDEAPREESSAADGASGMPALPSVRPLALAAGPAAVAIAPSVASDENGDVVPPAVETPVEAPMPAPVAEVAPSLQPLPAMRVIAVERAVPATWVVPPQPEPAQVAAAEPAAADFGRLPVPRASFAPAERQQVDEGAAARLADMAQEAERQETAREEAAAVRQEVARQEAARTEAAQADAARAEAERLQAARDQAARDAAARQEAARAEAAHAEAARDAAARDAAARQQAAGDEAARRDRDEAERREARLRAIGRQLDEEAAKRDTAAAVRSPSSLPYSLSTARRYRLFGRSDPNAEIVGYAETWSRKIERNFTLDLWREAVKQSHADPVVLVAVRSDGSIENMSFERSSGVPAIDDAVRRIVDGQRPYPAFPPELSRDYDVIEIRRSWHFDTAVRLY